MTSPIFRCDVPSRLASVALSWLASQSHRICSSYFRKLAAFPFSALLISLTLLAYAVPLVASAETPKTIRMKLLVVSADGKEAILPGIQSILDQINVPYDTLIASQTPLTPQILSDGAGAGNYQGVLLATGNLAYERSPGDWQSAFTADQWKTLWKYEADFRVRQATLYTNPSGLPDNYGMTSPVPVDTTSNPVEAKLTPEGKALFNYLNPASTITIKHAYTYLAQPDGTPGLVPLLSTAEGNPVVSIKNYSDGRQNLTITADGSPYLIHTLSLGYGVINWVSKGFFLGERKVYMTAQPDDIMLANDIWSIDNLNDTSGLEYRITGNDYKKLVQWQANVRKKHPNNAELRLEMPFNGEGSTGVYDNDTLTREIKLNPGAFNWINHTYTHALLTNISYADADQELRLNHQVASQLKLNKYHRDSMIQPEISGLANADFLQAAYDFGIRYILSDTSQPGWKSTVPNVGFFSDYQKQILIIPRYPFNLYYNLTTPEEWVSEYNYFYAPGGRFPAWDRPLTYAEILDKESDMWLMYMIRYDINPTMFHQANLRAYNGSNSLLGDLIDRTLAKYNAIFSLLIKSPSQHQIGVYMRSRMAYNEAGVQGKLVLDPAGNKIFLISNKAANVPLTGIVAGDKVETYGGQNISVLRVSSTGLSVSGPAW